MYVGVSAGSTCGAVRLCWCGWRGHVVLKCFMDESDNASYGSSDVLG